MSLEKREMSDAALSTAVQLSLAEIIRRSMIHENAYLTLDAAIEAWSQESGDEYLMGVLKRVREQVKRAKPESEQTGGG